MIDVQTFVESAKQFKLKLDEARDFDTILSIWRSNSFPYRMSSMDPFSSDYKAEVGTIYRRLSSIDYSVQNELTSSKQSADQFEVGFPWTSKNLDIISRELAKVSQAMLAIHRLNFDQCKILEFGSGWGNLAVPLARAGQTVTIADIDQGFIDRTRRICQREKLDIEAIQGDFLDISANATKRYDVIIFQASFHHCFEFAKLLDQIRVNMLTERGSILFFSEPVHRNLPFPWGLRFDGESLWAIMCNKWLELGFEESFFAKLMIVKGFFLSKIDGIDGFIGEGWSATRGFRYLNFEEWVLPATHDESFHNAGLVRGYGRFAKRTSLLPGLAGGSCSYYELDMQNYSAKPLCASVSGDQTKVALQLAPNESQIIKVRADCEEITIESDTYIPHTLFGNGDHREVGVAIKRVRMCD